MNYDNLALFYAKVDRTGKSSIAQALEQQLHDKGYLAYSLDGDNVRFGLNRDLGFSKDDRTENIRRISEVSRLFNDAGIIALVPVISPFRLDRESARAVVGKQYFFEIHVDTPLDICEGRDSKGLYKKARDGEIEEFTGISSPYEPPRNPSLRISTTGRTPEECAEEIFLAIQELIEPSEPS